jgi:fumarate reductase flavoprotein subunit
MSATVEAPNHNASALLCEAADRIGGSSAESGGIYYAAGTSLQKAPGIQDSADVPHEHCMIVNKFEIEPAVARRFPDNGAQCFDCLVSSGVEFRPEVMVVGQQHVPRGHVPKMFGFGHTQALSAAVNANA